MNIVANKDFLEVKLVSLIADYDIETIANLYQPIISSQAMSLYFTFWSEAKNQKITSIITHEQLLTRMQISPGDFVEARKSLEAIGLIKTYVQKENNICIYQYDVYAPKTPKSFFDNALLYGMLIKSIGENDANRFMNIYHLEAPVHEGKEITASFVEVFHPDLDNPVFAKVLNNTSSSIGRANGKIAMAFSYEKFFDSLSQISQIKVDAFTKKDMKELERLATLYGVDEATSANDVANVYNPHAVKGKRLDFIQLTKAFQDETNYNYLSIKRNGTHLNKVSGSSDLAHKINLLESISPKDYLSVLQNGTRPASSDLRLINDLSRNFHLANGVINAIVDFVSTVNNNILSRAYCEKVAASLAREGILTTIDAMNYLKKVTHPRQKEIAPIDSDKNKSQKKKEKENDNLPSWEQMIDDLDGGGSDGKA
ncbi:MAG: DnaD domain protein [Bacilli bacterium]